MGSKVFGIKVCEQCGQLFYEYVMVGRPRKFCSNACKQRHWREKQWRPAIRESYPYR